MSDRYTIECDFCAYESKEPLDRVFRTIVLTQDGKSPYKLHICSACYKNPVDLQKALDKVKGRL